MVFRSNKMPSISSQELKAKLDNGEKPTMIDVRTPEEWEQTGIIPGSITISMDQLGLQLQNGLVKKLEKQDQVVFICRSGSRSAQVTQFVIDNFPQIKAVNLTGGIISWYNNGGSFERID